MNFLIFRDIFPDFSEFILIFNVNNKFKMGKKGGIICAGHVDVTWHSGPRGSATQTHGSAYVAQM